MQTATLLPELKTFFKVFFLDMIGRQVKVSFPLVICLDSNLKQALYSSNTKFFIVRKVPYLRKNEYLQDKLFLGRQKA